MILFLLSLMSCHKPLTYVGARNYFSNRRCAKTLKYHMEMAGCKEMIVQKETEYQWLIRCQKPDHLRGEFWDNYILGFPLRWQYTNPTIFRSLRSTPFALITIFASKLSPQISEKNLSERLTYNVCRFPFAFLRAHACHFHRYEY